MEEERLARQRLCGCCIGFGLIVVGSGQLVKWDVGEREDQYVHA